MSEYLKEIKINNNGSIVNLPILPKSEKSNLILVSTDNDEIEWKDRGNNYTNEDKELVDSLKEEVVEGDAILVNKANPDIKISVNPNDLNNYSPDEWEPIGVVVIPSRHDVYGTRECGVMALLSASLTTPDEGQTSNASIAWGAYGTDYPELTNFNLVNKVGIKSGAQKADAVASNLLMNTAAVSYLPSDKNVADSLHTKAIDGTFYYSNDSNWNNCIPSPYLEDGSRNLAYYSTELSAYNALSDFAGKSNTEFLCSKATSQPDWRTDATITNNTSSTTSAAAGYHPASCVCWRFHTIGTSQGDWYLPACGELGYCYVRFKKINETISAVQSHFDKTFCPLATYLYWSSSELRPEGARYVTFNNGNVGSGVRNYSNHVRPFLRLKISKDRNYYTKSEVDTLIQNVDVTSQLEEVKSELESTISNTASTLEAKIPTKVSQLENDSKYQTESQVDSRIQQIVGAAPEALDTLEEIADKLSDNDDIHAALVNSIAEKLPKTSYTAADVLDKIKTVDGAGSGLDADMLDGVSLTKEGARFSAIPVIDSNGVMEIGRYIDFHENNTDTSDTNGRISVINGVLKYSSGTTNQKNIAFEDSNVESASKLQTKLLTNENLNNIKDNDFTTYVAYGGNTCTNLPADIPSSNYFSLQSGTISSARYFHILITSNGNMYKRVYGASNSWSEWKRLVTEDEITKTWMGTEAQYNALTTKDSNTLYCIPE